MPDGGAPALGTLPKREPWKNPKPLPANSDRLEQAFWLKHPNETPRAEGAMTVPEGLGVEHTVSQYTLESCGIYRTEIARISTCDRKLVSVYNPWRRAKRKELTRKRARSRIHRNGDAPLLCPTEHPPEHRWAIDRINHMALRRFLPPTGERLDAQSRPIGRTSWAGDIPAEQRHTDLWIFRTLAKRRGGHKLGPGEILAKVLEECDAPTPTYRGVNLSRAGCAETIAANWDRLVTERLKWPIKAGLKRCTMPATPARTRIEQLAFFLSRELSTKNTKPKDSEHDNTSTEAANDTVTTGAQRSTAA